MKEHFPKSPWKVEVVNGSIRISLLAGEALKIDVDLKPEQARRLAVKLTVAAQSVDGQSD